MKNSNKSRGFSLIELMVVISIIGVLMAIGAISFTTAQKKARDATRKSDIKAMSQALEQYYVINASYPTNSGCSQVDDTDYLPAGLPTDPRNISPNVYEFSCTASTFCVCAELESDTGNSDDGDCAFDSDGDETHFCVINQQ